jgi:hypothetical protein
VTRAKERKVWTWRALAFGGALAGAGVVAYFVADRLLSAPRFAAADSDHFAGGRFRNLGAEERHGFLDFLRWRLTSEPGVWERQTNAPLGALPPRSATTARPRRSKNSNAC